MKEFDRSRPHLTVIDGGGPARERTEEADLGSTQAGRELVSQEQLRTVEAGRNFARAIQAIDALPDEQQKSVLRMTYLEGLLPGEIAARLQIAPDEVQEQLDSAHRALFKRTSPIRAA